MKKTTANPLRPFIIVQKDTVTEVWEIVSAGTTTQELRLVGYGIPVPDTID